MPTNLARATIAVLMIAATFGGCAVSASPSPSASPLASAARTLAPTSAPPSAAATAAPTATPVPLPSGAMAWPVGDPTPLTPGTYFSAPPFDVPFTIEVAGAGWETGHLHGEFFDLIRFDAGASPALPTRWIAFAHPATIRGTGQAPAADLPASGLAPQVAIDALVARDDVIDSNVAAQTLFGLDGVRVDLRARTPNTGLFGGEEGTFGLDPTLPVRLAALPIDDGLLLVLVMAPAAELEAAWAEALPILETVAFVDPG